MFGGTRSATAAALLAAACLVLACGAPSGGGSGGSGSSSGGDAAEETMARLRPESSEAALEALRAQPNDPGALANAVMAYAHTDAPGMSWYWGLSYGAVAVDAQQHAQVAAALRGIIQRRIQVADREDGTSRSVEVRLAPSPMPVIERGGALRAPFANLFEIDLGAHLAVHMGDQRNLRTVQDVMIGYVRQLQTGGSALGRTNELNAWLLGLGDHTPAFVARLLEPAFPGQYEGYATTHAHAVAAEREYTAAHPFRATRAIMPDELVVLRR